MSVYLYDEAIVNKISNWTSTTKIHILGVNESSRLYQVIADETKDSPITLPMIAISRNRGFTINNTTRRPLTYDGITIDADYDSSIVANAIPITIPYQLDVYARTVKDATVIANSLIFNIINYPGMEIEVPNLRFNHTANLVLNPNVEDTSDIPERFYPDNLSRLSLSVTIEDGYLWDVRELQNVFIDLNIDDFVE